MPAVRRNLCTARGKIEWEQITLHLASLASALTRRRFTPPRCRRSPGGRMPAHRSHGTCPRNRWSSPHTPSVMLYSNIANKIPGRSFASILRERVLFATRGREAPSLRPSLELVRILDQPFIPAHSAQSRGNSPPTSALSPQCAFAPPEDGGPPARAPPFPQHGARKQNRCGAPHA